MPASPATPRKAPWGDKRSPYRDAIPVVDARTSRVWLEAFERHEQGEPYAPTYCELKGRGASVPPDYKAFVAALESEFYTGQWKGVQGRWKPLISRERVGARTDPRSTGRARRAAACLSQRAA